MTVSSTTSRWEYAGDGGTTVFAYNNLIFAASDLQVFVDAVLQTLTTDYSVSGAGDPAGGNVTFVTAPANGTAVTIIRSVPDTQTTDLPAGGAFPSESVEDALDRRTIVSQQRGEQLDRSLRFLSSDQNLPSAELPAIESLKGFLLGFNATTGAPEARATADLGSLDVDLTMPADGDFLVFDGTNWVNEAPSAARTSMGLGDAATKTVGVANGNVPAMNATGYPAANGSLITTLTLGNIALAAEARVVGRASGAGAGAATELTPAQVKAILSPSGGLLVAGATGSLSSTGVNITNLGGVTAPSRITIALSAASLSGTDNLLIQLGDAGGIETTGYVSGATATASSLGTHVSSTAGFIINIGVAARAFSGILTIVHVGSNVWVASVSGDDTVAAITGGGTKALSAALTQLQITRTGSDTFDAGTFTVYAE